MMIEINKKQKLMQTSAWRIDFTKKKERERESERERCNSLIGIVYLYVIMYT